MVSMLGSTRSKNLECCRLNSIVPRADLPTLEIDILQLTWTELTQKYSQFWAVEKVYFPSGETNAHHTLDFLRKSERVVQ